MKYENCFHLIMYEVFEAGSTNNIILFVYWKLENTVIYYAHHSSQGQINTFQAQEDCNSLAMIYYYMVYYNPNGYVKEKKGNVFINTRTILCQILKIHNSY